MNIEQYYIDALPTKGLRESLLHTQNTFIHYKRCPKLLNSMQYYYILALLIEY
ncbi:hypothetical protein [Salmonella phage SD-1_S14]|nr:hypothetical protein [Salmonella phage SD-1_S14]